MTRNSGIRTVRPILECLETRDLPSFLLTGALNNVVQPLQNINKDLNDAANAAMDTPAIKARLNGIGVVGIAPERRGPDYLARYVVEEIARWEGPIKASGLQVD